GINKSGFKKECPQLVHIHLMADIEMIVLALVQQRQQAHVIIGRHVQKGNTALAGPGQGFKRNSAVVMDVPEMLRTLVWTMLALSAVAGLDRIFFHPAKAMQCIS
ncbi:MAG: hypothetical protein KFF46_06080, partial [Desulfobacterales bacterium]|nr:hypothetical protein [Desulfobacterales bacterium]